MSIKDIIDERILVLDGAMGTMIQRRALDDTDFRGKKFRESAVELKGNNDVLNITRPDVITDIHRKYLEAGADIITTNTFSSQRISQADYGLERQASTMAYEGARIARTIADEYSTNDKPRFVAGSMGPTSKACSISPDIVNPAFRNITFDMLYDAYLEQAVALIRGGVDTILLETIFDTLNAKAAALAAVDAMKAAGKELPLMLSVTINDVAGRMLAGQTMDAFLVSMRGLPVMSVGFNCSFGARQMLPYIKKLAQISPYYISAYPNAGIPNALGQYDDTPEMMTKEMKNLVDGAVVNIIGGCCGTTEEYISKFSSLVAGKKGYEPKPFADKLQLSGLDTFELDAAGGFVCVGERCNVAGSRKFLRLIKEKKYDETLGIARKQIADGAKIIDVNMDDGLLDAEEEMTTFLNLIASEPDIARVPIMIDSSDWNVVLAGLKCAQGKCVVNSISLKNGEETFLRHAADVKRYGAAVVVMCFDEKGQATDYQHRIDIASRAYRLLTEKVGISPSDIIFDPNILTIATGMDEHNNYAVDFIRATRWIHTNLPGAHVSGGVSNLSFAFRGHNYIREAMHAVFLHHARENGMDMGIVNPSTMLHYEEIPEEHVRTIEDVVLNRDPDAQSRLVELAMNLKNQAQNSDGNTVSNDLPQWRTQPIGDRLEYAMVNGISEFLEQDLTGAVASGVSPMDIIEQYLLSGMNKVGELFGEGKMFLPQVVKTARTMKKAISFLEPYMLSDSSMDDKISGKILFATVKGDVHDIGKNIASVVMACNGYQIIDMGVMIPAEHIVKTAIDEKVDIVCLSGLITPSLEEMRTVVREMRTAGLDIPVMIGGAATSELYVALRVDTLYEGVVVWVKDASQNPVVASQLLNEKTRNKFIEELKTKYQNMRLAYQSNKKQPTVSIDEARKNKLNIFD